MKKKFLSIILSMIMVFGLIPVSISPVFAAETEYIERAWDDTVKTVIETSKPIPETAEKIKSETTELKDGGWYYAEDIVDIPHAVIVNGSANLILKDDCFLTVKGITVNEGNSLNIFAQSTDSLMGHLFANGEENCAGIGGGSEFNSGNITIHGGTITSNSRFSGAGIGGGMFGSGGNITIYDGIINAYGGDSAAGIGGGTTGSGGNIIIYDGEIHAYGGSMGAGIGGGFANGGGNIKIFNGTINAYGGENGSGIGCGKDNFFGVSTIMIYGGEVNAEGGTDASGIGGGGDRYLIYGFGDKLIVAGGSVTAKGNGEFRAIDFGAREMENNLNYPVVPVIDGVRLYDENDNAIVPSRINNQFYSYYPVLYEFGVSASFYALADSKSQKPETPTAVITSNPDNPATGIGSSGFSWVALMAVSGAVMLGAICCIGIHFINYKLK